MKHCPHFSRCGGCSSLDVPYSRQLEKKHQYLKERFLPLTQMVPSVIPCAQPYFFRHKLQLPFGYTGGGKSGKLLLGCYANDSHRVVDQRTCLIQDRSCSRIAWTLRDWARQNRLSVYNERTGKGLVRHALLRKGAGTGEILIGLVTNGILTAGRGKLVRSLLGMLERKNIGSDRIVGIIQNVNTRKTNVVLGNEEVVWWGRPYIKEILGTMKHKIGISTFFQVNPLQTPQLYNAVLEHIPDRARVIDCYCGVGSIALWISGRAEQVLGIEENRASVSAARTAARVNAVRNVSFIAGDAQKEMMIATKKQGFSVVVFDPPRKGLAEGMTQTIIESALNRVIYVSCNPVSLRRDIIQLQSDFTCTMVQGVDMFPHTDHIESVAVLERR
jgi:23S rRNA (uracil1939-C5)-methyltransferase